MCTDVKELRPEKLGKKKHNYNDMNKICLGTARTRSTTNSNTVVRRRVLSNQIYYQSSTTPSSPTAEAGADE